MLRVAALVAALAGCVQSGEVVCSDGRLCPPGYQCDDVNMRCLSQEQVAACSGREEGAECSFGGAPGACRRGACEPLTCGDGIKSVGEACDGTDFGDATCRDAGFYDEAGLVCTEFCTFDVAACTGFCGDQQVNGPELCDGAPPPGTCVDFGFDAGPITCGNSCGTSFDSCARFGWVAETTGLSVAISFDASSPSDVWVVGDSPSGHALAHFDGNAWTVDEIGGTKTLTDIEAIGPDEAWLIVATPAELRHFTNGAWTTVTDVPAGSYTGLWSAGPTSLFVATSDIGVLEWNGSAWQAVGSLAVDADQIDGTAADDLWIVTSAGEVHHWDGTSWTLVPVEVTVKQLAVAGSDDVWVIGDSTTATDSVAIGHWNGAQWTISLDPSLNPQFNQHLTAVTASSANDAWVSAPVGRARHFDGQHWSPAGSVVFNSSNGGFGEMQSFPGTTLGITQDGFFYRYRGQVFARLDTQVMATLSASASTAPAETIAIDIKNHAYHFDGTTWTEMTVDSAFPTHTNKAIWAAAANDVWVGGSGGRLYRFDGNTWSDSGWGQNGTVTSIVGFASNDVWIFGTSVYHYDGNTFALSPLSLPSVAFTAGGSSSSDLWVVVQLSATASTVYHWDGTSWTSSTVGDQLTAILSFSATNVIAAGAKRIWRFDGTAWTSELFPVLTKFVGLSATGPTDVFAATAGQLLHFDGERWSFLRPPDDNNVANRTIKYIDAHRGYIDLLYSYDALGTVPMRRLIRTRPWVCEATEAHCSDGVDDDCDGDVDNLDSDCP